MLRSSTLALCVLAASASCQDSEPSDSVRDAAVRALEWIARQATPVDGAPDAVLFPGTAEIPKSRSPEIYGGNAGILIFLENAAVVLEDERAKKLADALAKGLIAKRKGVDGAWASSRKTQGGAALYVGDAGVGHAFLVRARLRGDGEALKVAIAAGENLLRRAKRDGDALYWDDQTEIIFGGAGTTLFLLELAKETKDAKFADAAKASCRRLMQKSETRPGPEGGLGLRKWRWAMVGNVAYTGFSHGHAGTAYALARVGVELGDAPCLLAAREGAEHLKSISYRDGDSLYWPAVDGKKTSMGGWCHGPPGTARLFLYLYKKSGDASALEVVKSSAKWVMAQAGPPGVESTAKPFPPSFCCGVAGVIDFFCDLHRATGDAEYAAFARRAAAYLIAAAVADGDGVKWANGANSYGADTAQHNVDLMLGASGEAFALLRVLTLDRKDDPIVSLPDRL
jgi:lantibiotic modifying enzyme